MNTTARRILHGLIFTVLTLTTLVALFYAEEDWRGARAWAAAKRELQAKGESLEWSDFIPPPVPDDQNLAMAPLFVRALAYQMIPELTNSRSFPGTRRIWRWRVPRGGKAAPAFLLRLVTAIG